jgi:hypothetical protein
MDGQKDPLWEATQMENLDPQSQALRAIRHALDQIHQNSAVGYYCGIGTQTFALLTEAYASLLGNHSVPEVRLRFNCPNAKNPAKEAEEKTIDSIGHGAIDPEWLTEGQVLEAIECFSVVDRLELLDRIRERYCLQCGGDNGAQIGPCGCRAARRREQPLISKGGR